MAARPASPPLDLRGVSKSYGDQVVLTDIDLRLLPGDFAVVYGASGSGKTTLLLVAAGREEPDLGEASRRRDLTLLEGSDELSDHDPLVANIALRLPRRIRKTQAGAAQVAELFDLLELATPLADHRPRELSAGERQKATIARALITRPSALLLDEPLSLLEARPRLRVLSNVRDWLRGASVATLLATHDRALAAALSEQWLQLSAGVLGPGPHPRRAPEAPDARSRGVDPPEWT